MVLVWYTSFCTKRVWQVKESLLTVRVKVKQYFPKRVEKRRVGSPRIAPRKMNGLYFDLFLHGLY